MTYYQYIGLRFIGKYFCINPHRARIKDLDFTLSTIVDSHSLSIKTIWRNFLPVIIFTLKDLTSLKKTTAKLQLESDLVECSNIATQSAK